MVELQADNVVFSSRQDEASFFARLQPPPCVVDVAGMGRILHIQVERQRVDDERRFARWFRRRQSYWHDAVFGQPGRAGIVE